LAESAQLAFGDEKFVDMIPIFTAAEICHDYEDGINPKTYKVATESPLTEKSDTVTKDKVDAIGQHNVIEDFMELPERRKAFLSHWVYTI
jgi:hypothetical protein